MYKTQNQTKKEIEAELSRAEPSFLFVACRFLSFSFLSTGCCCLLFHVTFGAPVRSSRLLLSPLVRIGPRELEGNFHASMYWYNNSNDTHDTKGHTRTQTRPSTHARTPVLPCSLAWNRVRVFFCFSITINGNASCLDTPISIPLPRRAIGQRRRRRLSNSLWLAADAGCLRPIPAGLEGQDCGRTIPSLPPSTDPFFRPHSAPTKTGHDDYHKQTKWQ